MSPSRVPSSLRIVVRSWSVALVIAERADLGGLAVPQASWRTAGVPRGWGGGRRLRDGPIGRRGLTWAALGCSRRPPTSAHDGLALRGFTLTRRRRNRTFQAVGYTALLVLKAGRLVPESPPWVRLWARLSQLRAPSRRR